MRKTTSITVEVTGGPQTELDQLTVSAVQDALLDISALASGSSSGSADIADDTGTSVGRITWASETGSDSAGASSDSNVGGASSDKGFFGRLFGR